MPIMQKVKQLLINKYAIYGTFAFFALVKSFVPIAHIDRSLPSISIMPVDLANLIIYLPPAAFFYLLIYKLGTDKGRSIKLWNIFNTNAFILVCYLLLVALVVLQIYSMNVMQIAARGSLLSWCSMISLTMAITYKLRNMPSPIAILTALIASFWVIGFFEIPYQACRYYFADYNLTMDMQNLNAVLARQTLFTIPFIIAFFAWRIKITKASLVCIAAFTILWIIWLVPGHFRTLYIVDLDISTVKSIFPEQVDWLWYSVGKMCKTLLTVFVLFLNYDNLTKGGKCETISSNKPL